MKKLILFIIAGTVTLLMVRFSFWKKHVEPDKASDGSSLIQSWLETNAQIGRWDVEAIRTNSVMPRGLDYKAAALTRGILEAGPNLAPHAIELLRKESNPGNLTNLVVLIGELSRIFLYNLQSNGLYAPYHKTMEQLPVTVSNFLAKWDAGTIQNPEQNRQVFDSLFYRSIPERRIIADEFRALSQYGIYALPLTINTLAKTNSVHAMAFFISKADIRSLYNYWLEPQKMLPTHEEKLKIIRDWWSREHTKFNELHPLYEKIDAAVKALPNLPIETNAVTSGSSP